MQKHQIAFAALEEVVAAHINKVKEAGEEPVIIHDKVTRSGQGYQYRTILVADQYTLTSFAEIWLEDLGKVGDVKVNTIFASDARRFVDYLDKKTPRANQGRAKDEHTPIIQSIDN